MESLKNDKEVQDKVCAFWFDNLQNIHKEGSILDFPKDLPCEELPIFVSWHLKGILRGCIGTFKADKLSKVVPVYSYMAAFQDKRFPPIQPAELPYLSCSVSFLSDFEDIEDPLDWEIGKHGIEIEFVVDDKEYRGTYLPHVAEEQGWTQEDALNSLLKKAGFKSGTLDDIRGRFSLLRRYQSVKFKLDYEDYVKMKEEKVREKFLF